MILAVNIGNSSIALGFYHDGDMTVEYYNTKDYCLYNDFERLIKRTALNKLTQNTDFDGAIISSVVPDLTGEFSSAIYNAVGKKPIEVSKDTDFGFDISAYDRTLIGADRLCGCASALAKHPPPIIIFDLGTATTVNVINTSGAFIGGAILPGVYMGLFALSEHTSLLPKCSLDYDPPLIGLNTAECLSSGAVHGTASIIDGMAERIEKRLLKSANIIATGGNASLIIPFCKTKLIHEPELILDGLVILYKKINNVE